MAFITSFKYKNFDMCDGFYLTKKEDKIFLLTKLKIENYNKNIILKTENTQSNGDFVCSYNDNSNDISSVINNILSSNSFHNDIIVINDNVTISALQELFSAKKLEILTGESIYRNALENNNSFIEVNLISKTN